MAKDSDKKTQEPKEREPPVFVKKAILDARKAHESESKSE